MRGKERQRSEGRRERRKVAEVKEEEMEKLGTDEEIRDEASKATWRGGAGRKLGGGRKKKGEGELREVAGKGSPQDGTQRKMWRGGGKTGWCSRSHKRVGKIAKG